MVVTLGVLLVLVGLVLAVRPFRSLAALVILLVGALVLSGVGDLVRGHRPWGPLRGLVQLLVALGLLLWPGPGLGVLVLVVAGALLLDGLLGLVEGLRSSGTERWAAALTGLALVVVYVVQAYTAVYDDVRHADLRPGAQLLAREMAQRCLSERGVLVSLGQSLLLDRPIWDRDPTTGPFGARLEQNVPTGRVPVPLLVAQGEADTLITPAAQESYVADRCAEGQQVDYRTYPGRDHLSLVADGSPAMDELFTWTADRLTGEPVQDRCPG